jgi:short-subunit dehydrogenase
LGKAIAFALAHAGAEVVVTDLDADRVEAVVAELKAAAHTASGSPLNVTVVEQVAAARDRCGPIDILVNNAGVVFGGDFLAVPLAHHNATVAVNLTGLLNVTHAFLPGLIARPHSCVVNIASASAFVPLPRAASYSATKAGVVAFSDSLREELRLQGHRNVHVATICPSYIATGLFAGAKPPWLTWMLMPENVADAVVRAIVRKQDTVLLPWTVSLLHTLTAVLPAPAYRGLCRLLGVSASMADWHGHS